MARSAAGCCRTTSASVAPTARVSASAIRCEGPNRTKGVIAGTISSVCGSLLRWQPCLQQRGAMVLDVLGALVMQRPQEGGGRAFRVRLHHALRMPARPLLVPKLRIAAGE